MVPPRPGRVQGDGYEAEPADLPHRCGDDRQSPGGGSRTHFVCAAALVTPDGREHVLERQWRGRVIREKRGTNGFGYDPVFVPEGLDVTSAELDPAEKDARSHRGQAFSALVPTVAEALRAP
jgi:inosine/xanthosine triphosphate pyrophosphatase family protein